MTSAFTGFPDSRGRFFRQLHRNQNKTWFLAHKAQYETQWVEPMRALLEQVALRLIPAYKDVPLKEPHLFRIYRDVRFSHDKTPYKTHIGGMIDLDVPTPAGSRVQAPTAMYLHVGLDVVAAAGQYVLEGPSLQRYRQALLDPREGPRLTRMLAPLRRAGYVPSAYSALKRAPRGVAEDHPRLELLKMKGFIVRFPNITAADLATAGAVTILAGHARRLAKLTQWLAACALA